MSADPQESSAPLAEISHGPSAFEEFLDRNQKKLIALVILLVIATAVFVVYRGIEKSAQETAGAALNQAEDTKALEAVISEHPDTNAAQSAMVLLAEQQWKDGQQDAAIKTLRNFTSAHPGHPAYPTALATLGSKLMAQGQSADAISVFEQILDEPKARFIAPYALISLGDIAKIGGDLDKAESSYKQVQTEYSESGFANTASRRIGSLRAKPPVEIEAPLEPITPPAGAPSAPFSVTPAPAIPTPAPESPSPAETAPADETPAPAQDPTSEPRSETSEEAPADPEY